MPATESPATFEYATFSQHGAQRNYLRDNLECDEGGTSSCGTASAPAGERVHAFVADRSHANYPDPCSLDCTRKFSEIGIGVAEITVPFIEWAHDGEKPWGRNDDPSALLAMPAAEPWTVPTQANWTNWPGRWGVPEGVEGREANGPRSPGEQAPYTDPAGWDCGDVACTQDGESVIPGSQSQSSARKADCGSWFSPSVAATACDQATLTSALKEGTLMQDGKLRLERGQRTGASARGVSQLMGAPIAVNETIQVEGPSDSAVVLQLQVNAGNRVVAVTAEVPVNTPMKVLANPATGSVTLLAGIRTIATSRLKSG